MCSARLVLALVALCLACCSAAAQTNDCPVVESRILRTFTNGPAVFAEVCTVRRCTNDVVRTDRVFQEYLTDSLSHRVWTNFIARTNGRDMRVWSARWHPGSWPTNPPALMWNSNSLVFGMSGFTALSPCWTGEGASGQIPVTAFTRRHGYARGHGMGTEGVNTNFAGARVWFLAADNTVVQATIANAIVRAGRSRNADYTIFIFDRDLPESIQPMRVIAPELAVARYPVIHDAPRPLFRTEQTGHVSTDVPGWTVNFWKGGDSGSPDMLPLPGELVFISGRSTSGASATMQEDMDELSRWAGLKPDDYRLRWVEAGELSR